MPALSPRPRGPQQRAGPAWRQSRSLPDPGAQRPRPLPPPQPPPEATQAQLPRASRRRRAGGEGRTAPPAPHSDSARRPGRTSPPGEGAERQRVAPAAACLLLEVDDALHGAVPLHHAHGLQRRHLPAAARERRPARTPADSARGLGARPSRRPYIERAARAAANRGALAGLLVQLLRALRPIEGGGSRLPRGCAPISGASL